jgi:MinD superfamily P-loop ATPase
MQLTIASGKGGTGKTTVAVNLACTLSKTEESEKIRLLDCDVEEPNVNLFLNAENLKRESATVKIPVWNARKCNGCGKCASACRYNAMASLGKEVLIFPELCHSCGVCEYVCKEGAITETDREIGVLESNAEDFPFFFGHGKLNIGEVLSPPLIRQTKKFLDPEALNIVDAPPGTACPVVAALKGTDVAALVTEPTPFGLNDLKLAVDLCFQMGIPAGVIINRSDGDDKIICDYLESQNVPLLGKIPFKREYAEAYSKGEILVEKHPELQEAMLDIFVKLKSLASENVERAETKEKDIERVAEFSIAPGNAGTKQEITIISGKGGAGKTTVAASFAYLAGTEKVITDCDVDAADMHLLMMPKVAEEKDFSGGSCAIVDTDKCAGCHECARLCRFEAVRHNGPENRMTEKSFTVNEMDCEGCGLCAIACPLHAITMEPAINGKSYVSDSFGSAMSHAKLGTGEENSGKLVSSVRKKASELAESLKKPLIISDGPPGAGCPVIASISGISFAVIVTEPTVSGLHDMERVLKLTKHFDVESSVIINKSDLNPEMAQKIKDCAASHKSEIIGEIPFDKNVNEALKNGSTLAEYGKGPASEAVKTAWERTQKKLEKK